MSAHEQGAAPKRRWRKLLCRVFGHNKATMTYTCRRCGEYTIQLDEQIRRTVRRGA